MTNGRNEYRTIEDYTREEGVIDTSEYPTDLGFTNVRYNGRNYLFCAEDFHGRMKGPFPEKVLQVVRTNKKKRQAVVKVVRDEKVIRDVYVAWQEEISEI
jgi:hypothetical protein